MWGVSRQLGVLGAVTAALVAAQVASATTRPYDARATAACLKQRPEFVTKVNGFDPVTRLQMPVYPVRRFPGGGLWFVVGFFPPWPDAVHITELHLYFFPSLAKTNRYAAQERAAIRKAGDDPRHIVMVRRNAVLEWPGSYTAGHLRIVLNCLRSKA